MTNPAHQAVEAAVRQIMRLAGEYAMSLATYKSASPAALETAIRAALARPLEVAAGVETKLSDVDFDELWLLFSQYEAQFNKSESDEALADKRANIDNWLSKHFAASRAQVAAELGRGEVTLPVSNADVEAALVTFFKTPVFSSGHALAMKLALEGFIQSRLDNVTKLVRWAYEDAAAMVEQEDPRTSDWMWDDRNDLANAIHRRCEETIQGLATPPGGAGCSVNAEISLKTWRKGVEQGPVPVLYTDVINDEQVHRDDLWLATTSQLATPAAPVPLVGGELRQWHDEADRLKKCCDYATSGIERMKFATMLSAHLNTQPIQAQDATDASGYHDPDRIKAWNKANPDAAILASTPPAPAVDGRTS